MSLPSLCPPLLPPPKKKNNPNLITPLDDWSLDVLKESQPFKHTNFP